MPEKSCVVIPRDIPFDVAGLVGCAVTTGVGAVWRTAGVDPVTVSPSSGAAASGSRR